MLVIAEMHGWDYRSALWFGSMILVGLILLLASIAVFARREKQVDE